MASVVTRTQTSVHAAYLAMKDRLGVSPAALYEKLNHTEPEVVSVLVRQTAADAAKVIDAMPSAKMVILPGLEVFYLDGNHLAATEHRLAELRTTREGPLPGQSLALLDAQRELIVDLVPCEDGYTQERALLPEMLKRLRDDLAIIADRNFCTTKFLFGLAGRKAFFVIRQHGSTLTWRLRGKRRRMGRIDSGTVYEQGMELPCGDATLSIRRITLCLNHPTENGETEIQILTNLSVEQATALQAAQTYGTRWTVEGAFQTLTDVLRCEIATLGYPRAALFGFATAVLAYNTYAVVRASLRAAHGTEVIQEKLSDYHLLGDVAATYVGMDIAVPDACWEPYRSMPMRCFAKRLKELAHRVKLTRYPKQKRGPKKPQPRKKSGRRNHHISTARVLAERRKRSP
jgi:IS4 transposase